MFETGFFFYLKISFCVTCGTAWKPGFPQWDFIVNLILLKVNINSEEPHPGLKGNYIKTKLWRDVLSLQSQDFQIPNILPVISLADINRMDITRKLRLAAQESPRINFLANIISIKVIVSTTQEV